MKISDRLLSFVVEPGKGNRNGNRIDISFFKDGKFIVSQSPVNHMDDTYKEMSACTIGSKEQFATIAAFLEKARQQFVDAPEDSLFAEYEWSEYYMCIDGFAFRGSLAMTDESFFPRLSKEDEKKARWNNKIVDFTSRWNKLVTGMEIMGYPLNKPEEEYLLSPRSLFLLNRAKKALGPAYKADSVSMAVKKAAKLAFADKNLPTGDKRFLMEKNLQTSLLPILNLSFSKSEFDKDFASLCKEVASLDTKRSYSEIAYWMDTAYLLLLLREEDIIDERKIAFMHPPISKDELLCFYEKADQSSYKLELSKKRLLGDGYSPIYRYLIDLLDFDERFNEKGSNGVSAS